MVLTFGTLLASILYPTLAIFSIRFALASFVGFYDFFQRKRPVLANFPLIGRFRFLLESIRPELRQYFWESDKDELPYSRNQRLGLPKIKRNIGSKALDQMKIIT